MRQFRLNIRYKPGKEYIIPDILLRLTSVKPSTIIDNHLELDILFSYEYYSIQVNILEAFYKRLLKGYTNDLR